MKKHKLPTVDELSRLWTVDPENALALCEALLQYLEDELELKAWKFKTLAEQMRALRQYTL